ncbi:MULTISPECIES: AMP-dependent synthetase/ligase [Janibacter]|jgi:long-chain acyl-CoA synthetase|uniref:Acyl-CoA synthetase n=2 Tax=Janibacter melonis TaxID=262209 RepID=A0A5P8FQ38_9MICO|nr:AMP-dependent synthetase/ligase [Janibacter melonis]MCB5990397.1 AMP-dependent synthetase/ligase [Janibacter melonis]QFQ31696.2 AMP-binding protein [Janibacter melonis]
MPRLVEGDPRDSLGRLPQRNADNAPQRVAFAIKEHGSWRDVTTSQFLDDVRGLAKGFVAAGIEPGDRVAIMARTRYEWTLVDFAAWMAAAVPVPIYETSSAEQVEWIIADSGASALVVETAAHAATVRQVADGVPTLQHTWVIDNGDLTSVSERGAEIEDSELEARLDATGRDSLATIIYTSGTTGRPKGCELTHDNFLGLAENAIAKLGDVVARDGASTLLFLPLAHVFARFIEVLCVTAEAKMGHSADIANILDDFQAFQPSFILAVPRVFEKIYNKANETATADGKGAIFERAADTAVAYSEALDKGSVPLGLKIKHAVFDKLVYAKLRTKMGGRVQYAVSGGAPLGTRLGHFFRGVGVTILEGYGLTETTAPLSVNIPEKVKIGTVGPPLPGVSVRIEEDGEILVQGLNVLRGYRGNEQASAEAVVDGWFHTGDLGELDEDGYLRITGRKKEILVTAGGKNVAPAVLEDRLRAHPLVSQCMVVGDGKPFIAALVTIDEEMLPGWAANNGLGAITVAQARTDETVLAEIQRAVDDANKAVSKAESIRKFAVLEEDFTEENGTLTPSLKLKRNVVMRDYEDQVEALYG